MQRGDIAAYDPYIRAKWALDNGADIVLMLPVMFSMAQAERFAVGGVSLLSSTGIVDSLSFGAECGDAAILSRLANSLKAESTEYKAALASALSSGKSFPAARSAALCAMLGEENARLLSCANCQNRKRQHERIRNPHSTFGRQCRRHTPHRSSKCIQRSR